MRVNNEKGITLVELLAVIVLFSLVTTLIFTTFSISIKYNIVETKKLKLQQEANYLITSILQKHRTTECYNLKINDDTQLVFTECGKPEVIIGDNFMYTLTNITNEEVEPVEPIQIHPKKTDLKTILTVTDLENPKLQVSINTIFTRYKSNAEEEED